MDGVVLVAYASRHRTARVVAERICESLHADGVRAHLRPAGELRDLSGYGPVVLGGSLSAGRWDRGLHRFLRRHGAALRGRPLAAFAFGPALGASLEGDEARGLLAAALVRHGVEAVRVEVFGGQVDPSLSRRPGEDTPDWDAIEAWAQELPEALEARSPALV